VSVAITAYNHQELLPLALESVLQQKADFPIEIVVGEDRSRDDTVAVARAYQRRYPEIIRLFVNETNLGVQQNTYQTLERCRGEFTAWLDADDYWTDPNKLATQVAAMRSDPSLSVCFHYVRWVTGEGKVQRARYPEMPPGRYGLEDCFDAASLRHPRRCSGPGFTGICRPGTGTAKPRLCPTGRSG
jgi:glycosyltransferase involved in cell wall biosynthesis